MRCSSKGSAPTVRSQFEITPKTTPFSNSALHAAATVVQGRWRARAAALVLARADGIASGTADLVSASAEEGVPPEGEEPRAIATAQLELRAE